LAEARFIRQLQTAREVKSCGTTGDRKKELQVRGRVSGQKVNSESRSSGGVDPFQEPPKIQDRFGFWGTVSIINM
jgi:hypothetical protein